MVIYKKLISFLLFKIKSNTALLNLKPTELILLTIEQTMLSDNNVLFDHNSLLGKRMSLLYILPFNKEPPNWE